MQKSIAYSLGTFLKSVISLVEKKCTNHCVCNRILNDFQNVRLFVHLSLYPSVCPSVTFLISTITEEANIPLYMYTNKKKITKSERKRHFLFGAFIKTLFLFFYVFIMHHFS